MNPTPKSGIPGISWHNATNQWKVNVTRRGKTVFGGYHDAIEAAAVEVQAIHMMSDPRLYMSPSKRPPGWTPDLQSRGNSGFPPKASWRVKMFEPTIVTTIWHPLDEDWWLVHNPVNYDTIAAIHAESPLCAADVFAAPTHGHSQFALSMLWHYEKLHRGNSTQEWESWGYEIRWPKSWTGVDEITRVWGVNEGKARLGYARELEASISTGVKFETLVPPSRYEPEGMERHRHGAESKHRFWRNLREDVEAERVERYGPWRLGAALGTLCAA
jgi:hypothetical protein